MKVNELSNLWIGYNRDENFRILIYALDEEEAQEVANGYCSDAQMNGVFEVTEFENVNVLVDFDCDYVIAKSDVI